MTYAADTLGFRTVELSGETDLLSFLSPGGVYFERHGEGIVTCGIAKHVDVAPGSDHVARAAETAAALLSAAGSPDAVVAGGLPFDGRGAATLVVPEVAIIRRGGRTTAVLAGDAELPKPSWPAPAEPRIVATEYDPSPEDYVKSVDAARERIRAGDLEKVVLARSVIERLASPLERRAILAKLRVADPASYAFAVNGMIGASPELLVARDGRSVRSDPLAGSARRGVNGESDAAAAQSLLASAKDRAEHAFVSNAVCDALGPVCSSIEVDAQPSLIATSRVWHLQTRVRGTLHSPAPNALALAARLHPTPAVCGTPRDQALETINELEGFDRGLYAGLVGWMDGRGDGEWAIALRCAHIEGTTLRLYARSGIVAASDPDAELAETDAKLDVLRSAIGA